jgi:hypothetical protein
MYNISMNIRREVKLADNCQIDWSSYPEEIKQCYVNQLLLDWVRETHPDMISRAEKAVDQVIDGGKIDNITDTNNTNLSGDLLNEQC